MRQIGGRHQCRETNWTSESELGRLSSIYFLRVRLSELTRMRDKVTTATAHSMRECDALSPLEDIFSVDPIACWNLQSPILESINLPIEAISEGFPDLSSR